MDELTFGKVPLLAQSLRKPLEIIVAELNKAAFI
jgi:hypothetical protein